MKILNVKDKYDVILFLLAGVSLAGDDELLAGPKESQAPKRDEWMTTLPPERKVMIEIFTCVIVLSTIHQSMLYCDILHVCNFFLLTGRSADAFN